MKTKTNFLGENSLSEIDREKAIDFVVRCQQPNGGFGGNPQHDAHIIYTTSAIQILVMLDALDKIDVEAVVKCRKYIAPKFKSNS